MKFYDKTVITVQSSKWGDGVVSARREAGAPYWGPAGWNGGKWGSVILRGNPHINTLVDFHNKKKFVADKWQPWRTKDQYGKDAEDLILQLPLGSLVRDVKTWLPLRQCLKADDEFVVCRGWQGGIGNMHFKNSINQYPQFALLGEPGETREIEIELQLLADVALIGTPSVGKSSLINTIANVKAKVADYPFTTLIPNLWSVKYHNNTFNVIDVPGLIAWAAEWKWLGNEFLRHIRKARVLCFMLDMGRYEHGMDDFAVLFDELLQYLQNVLSTSKDFWKIQWIRFELQNDGVDRWSLHVIANSTEWEKTIMQKNILIICNKADLVEDKEIIQEYVQEIYAHIARYFKKTFSLALMKEQFHPYVMSTYSEEGVQEWLGDIVEYYIQPLQNEDHHYDQDVYDFFSPTHVEKRKDTKSSLEIIETTELDMPYLIEHDYLDEQDARYSKVWTVDEAEVSRLTYMLPWWNDEAEMRFRWVLDKKRFLQKIISAWLVKGDIIHVKSYYEWVDDRYVRY